MSQVRDGVVKKAGELEFTETWNFFEAQYAGFRQVAEIAEGLYTIGRLAPEVLALASCDSLASRLATIGCLQPHAYLSFRPALSALEGMLALPRTFFDVAPHSVELARFMEHFKATVQNKAEQLGSLGWTIPLDASPQDTIRLLECSTSAETADAAFAAFYEADGAAAYVSLKEDLLSQAEMEPWREEVTTACARLEDYDYLSCVNDLLPVLDGFGATKSLESRFHNKRTRDRFFARKLADQNLFLNQALWLSLKAFVDRLFERIDFADESRLSKRLNRHARLHGRGAYSPTFADCLRLLQALHTLSLL